MNTIIISVAFYIIAAYLLWVLFIAVMALRWKWPTLPLVAKVLAVPVVLVAVALDILFNVASNVLFFDLQREVMFTQRMGRYKNQAVPDWRTKIAVWVCSNLLDYFEIGGHCK